MNTFNTGMYVPAKPVTGLSGVFQQRTEVTEMRKKMNAANGQPVMPNSAPNFLKKRTNNNNQQETTVEMSFNRSRR